MIAAWMVRMLVATGLIAIGARAADEAARLIGRPRRWVWVAALAVAAALPWLGGVVTMPAAIESAIARWLPGSTGLMTLSWADPVAVTTAPTGAAGAGAAGGGGVLDTVLLAGWAIASLAVALAFGHALRRFGAVRRRGRAAGAEGVDIVRSESLGPATVGILRPTIVLPRWLDELAPEERALIVQHEHEHAAARDPGLLTSAALPVMAAPWCVPLWWMHRRLRDAAEADCDARVLARGADRDAYGRALLSTAGRPSAAPFTAPALAGANVTRLRRRILMMTEPRPKHAVLRVVPLVALAVVAAFVACDAAGDATGAPEAVRPTVIVEQAAVDPVRDGTGLLPNGGLLNGDLFDDDLLGHRESGGSVSSGRSATRREVDATAAVRQVAIEEAQWTATETGGTPATGATITLREVNDRSASLDDATGIGAGGEGDGAPARLREQREVRLRAAQAGHIAALIDDDGPLFYLDGVRIASPSDPTLRELDPNDIDRVEVVKGEAATTIFGDAAAGGVVQIYTKENGS